LLLDEAKVGLAQPLFDLVEEEEEQVNDSLKLEQSIGSEFHGYLHLSAD
jgi:hypothetical protein